MGFYKPTTTNKIMEGSSQKKIQGDPSCQIVVCAREVIGGEIVITNNHKERNADSNLDSMSSQTPAAKMLLGIGVTEKYWCVSACTCICSCRCKANAGNKEPQDQNDKEKIQIMTQTFSVNPQVSLCLIHKYTKTKDQGDDECCITTFFPGSVIVPRLSGISVRVFSWFKGKVHPKIKNTYLQCYLTIYIVQVWLVFGDITCRDIYECNQMALCFEKLNMSLSRNDDLVTQENPHFVVRTFTPYRRMEENVNLLKDKRLVLVTKRDVKIKHLIVFERRQTSLQPISLKLKPKQPRWINSPTGKRNGFGVTCLLNFV